MTPGWWATSRTSGWTLRGARPGPSPSRLATLNATRPLLLLDGCAERGSLAHWLQKELLARLETSVKVVIAGHARLELVWHQEAGWRSLIHPLPLTGLAPAECRTYLARRGLHAPTLVEQIVQATAGHP